VAFLPAEQNLEFFSFMQIQRLLRRHLTIDHGRGKVMRTALAKSGKNPIVGSLANRVTRFGEFSAMGSFLENFRSRQNVRATVNQEPILRLGNLQLQRQRCSRLERFSIAGENIFVFKTH
jgi:hypothetical protein